MANAMTTGKQNAMSVKSTAIPWNTARKILETMFRKIGVDTFYDVTIGKGHAHCAFSTEDRVLLIQPFMDKKNVPLQCEELRLLKEQLLDSGDDSAQIMTALYFPDEAKGIGRIRGITRITPGNMASFRRFFLSGRKRSAHDPST